MLRLPRPATICGAVAPELTPALARTSALLEVGDPSRTRTVYVAVALLVALGLALVVLALWLVRRTRVDPQVLAPLELMGDRSWRREADPESRVQRLDEVRPDGALTLAAIAPMLAADPTASAEDVAGRADGDDGEVVEAPVLGPPAPPHVVTPEEIDEILQRLADADAAGRSAATDAETTVTGVDVGEAAAVDAAEDASGDGARTDDDIAPPDVTAPDDREDVRDVEHVEDLSDVERVEDVDHVERVDLISVAEADDTTDAPDGQRTHG
jgi:hypothetical protein